MGEVLEFKRKTTRKTPERKDNHLTDATTYCATTPQNCDHLRINTTTGKIDAQERERIGRLRHRMEVIEKLIAEIKTLGHKIGGNSGNA